MSYIAETHTEIVDDGHGATLFQNDPYLTVQHASGATSLCSCGEGTGSVSGIAETTKVYFFEDDDCGETYILNVFSDGSWLLFAD